ncbi:hypothetical protein [Chryseobacterium polytrichastri]|uniref:Uncharacterized protein n=1 Tax=Chryseobacterium polytrichastri TaxID=1302687 RepID=A0A1M7K238_9FLAO|nr:hypothetical protein [Chryseobacterium polytrichastri]SHM59350.1 hypothetical protein SAMN05444267_105619 [Chryseobacterium polytrichastri]
MKKEKPAAKPKKACIQQYNYRHQLVPIKKIPVKEAVEMLRSAGIDVQEEEAEEIMEFLYILTQITIKEFFSYH